MTPMPRNDAVAQKPKRIRKLHQTVETYQSLDQKIRDLWASRNLEVIEERVRALDNEKYEWTIIAKPAKPKP